MFIIITLTNNYLAFFIHQLIIVYVPQPPPPPPPPHTHILAPSYATDIYIYNILSSLETQQTQYITVK